MQKTFTIAIAGTTTRTLLCAQSLYQHPNFKISFIITPSPKPVGRKKVVTANPVDLFAQEKQIQIIYVDQKITPQTQKTITDTCQNEPPDFLLVVDFGYLVPKWLLQLPQIAPINIHPSALPKWRGSSPGQFVLLYGDQQSAVSVIKMNQSLDQGPLIHQEFFEVSPNWTQTEYYQHSFKLIAPKLPQLLKDFAQNPTKVTEQPLESPTPIAKRLTKQDSFIEWQIVGQHFLKNKKNNSASETTPTHIHTSNTVLQQAFDHHQSWQITLEHACRAFSPWPYLWTLLPTNKGPKRMKIFSQSQVQIEGQQFATWNQVKNQVIETI